MMALVEVSPPAIGLSALVALLAAIAAAVGLFSGGTRQPQSFATLRGQTLRILGWEVYRHDTLFIGAGYRGQNAVALFR
jgi:hypothetical protein